MKRPIWFKVKRYGWGWCPAKWQGWAIVVAYVLVIYFLFKDVDQKSHSGSDTLIGVFIPLVVATIILVLVSYLFGEKPSWHWPSSRKDN